METVNFLAQIQAASVPALDVTVTITTLTSENKT
jgi:hypothetical protein